jgi:serpin B
MKDFVPPTLPAAALKASDSRIMPAMNAFTIESYKQLRGGHGNLILSPFNIAAALFMLLGGARGRTSEEIQSVLRLHYDSSYDAALGAFLAGLAKAGNAGDNEMHTANGLWVREGWPIQPAFEKALTDSFQAPPTPLNFIANPEAARSQINGWVEERTKQRIKNLLQLGAIKDDTGLILTSAIYFYGNWQHPFVTSNTQPAPFTLPTGAVAEASFMNRTSRLGYAETPAAQILEMPYAGTGMAFDIVLPRAVTGLPDIEKSLTLESLTGWLGSLETRSVQVSLPKFRAESAFSLGEALSAMGMPTAFTDQADFSGISGADPQRRLSVDMFAHKAFVDVSEKGTEAAAAGAIWMRVGSAKAVQPVVFRADHPFLFLIRDTGTGTVLFIGRLMDPR